MTQVGKARYVVAMVVPALALVAGAAPAAAAGPVDQAQTAIDTAAAVSDIVIPGQTFTAGRTGALDQLDIAMERLADTTSEPVTVQIRTVVDGEPSDTVLATASVPVSSLPVADDDDETDAALVPVPIGPVAVTAGTQYAIVVSRSAVETRVGLGEGDPYAGGQFTFETDCCWTEIPQFDIAFQTHVSTPAPPPPADGALSGVLGAIVDLLPPLAPVINPVRNLLRGLGL